MQEHMARLRSMRKSKGGETAIKDSHEGMDSNMIEAGIIFDDIRNGWNRTFHKKLGRKIKKTFTSKPAKQAYKGLADAGLQIGSRFTGLPLGLARGSINRAIDGASIKNDNIMVQGGSLVCGVPQVQIRKGSGFTGSQGTRYDGSLKSPTAGGSMYAA